MRKVWFAVLIILFLLGYGVFLPSFRHSVNAQYTCSGTCIDSACGSVGMIPGTGTCGALFPYCCENTPVPTVPTRTPTPIPPTSTPDLSTCSGNGGMCQNPCGQNYVPIGIFDCPFIVGFQCCRYVAPPTPTNTPVPSPTPCAPASSICNENTEGGACYDSALCPKGTNDCWSSTCRGVTVPICNPNNCGSCFCTKREPYTGSCITWGNYSACTLQYNGMYCRTRYCTNPVCCEYEIDCTCGPEPSPGSGVPTNTQVPPTRTPTPTNVIPTPTNPVGANCMYQGRKVIMPGNQQIPPAIGQVVYRDGLDYGTGNPYFIQVVGGPTLHTISVSTIDGYNTGYSMCTNATNCHNVTPTPGSAVAASCPISGYVDIWWHFTPWTPTPTTNIPPSVTVTPTNTVPPTSTPTVITPTPAGNQCQYRAMKVLMPGNNPAEPARSQEIFLNGLSYGYGNPVTIDVAAGTNTMTVANLSGYTTGYTMCVNSSACHLATPTPGDEINEYCPDGGYVDVMWHFTPWTPTPTQTPTSTATPTQTPTMTATPTPTVAYRARSRYQPVYLGCSDLDTDYSWADGTLYSLTGEIQRTQVGGSYVSWDPLTSWSSGTKTIDILNRNNFTRHTCWAAAGAFTQSLAAGGLSINITPGTEYTYEFSLVPPGPWYQTTGGDVYASGDIVGSRIPMSAAYPPQDAMLRYTLDGQPNMPGVVVHGGSTVDFSLDTGNDGTSGGDDNFLSSTRWLVQDDFLDTQDYYRYLALRLGNPVTGSNVASVNGYADLNTHCTNEVCYFTGPLSVNGAILVPSGQRRIVLINGNLTINSNITLADTTSFIAFIVNGTILVANGVGNPAGSYGTATAAPVNVAGIYVATASFVVEATTPLPQNQFVGEGMFIARSFTLHRNLSVDNAVYPGSVFRYNPSLLLTMPQIMQDVPVHWQEVAP